MMTANVNVNGSILKISVGEGRQTFKWLAQIIQARISEANSLRAEFGPTNVVVIGLKNHADQLINPTDSLFEHQCKSNDPDSVRSDDLTFTAEVLPQFESDQFGNPVYGEWLQTAYMVSESAQKWAVGMQQWRDTELERQNEKQEDSDDEDRWNPNQNAASSLIHIGDDEFLKIDLKTSFMLDWGNIKFSWLDKAKLSLKIAIHEVLKENYDVICHLFLHYCGVGTVGQRFGMTLRELNHLLTLATRTHKEKCTQIADTVYKKITRVKEPKKKAESGMFVMKAPTAVVSGSGFAKPTSPTTNDSDSESPTPQPEAFEEPAPEEPPVEDVPTGVRLSPLLSRSAFAECLMCYAVEEEMGSSIPEAITNFISGPLKAILATFHRTFLKYTDPEMALVREEYDSLREFFAREAEMHPTLGPSISFQKFSQIVTKASLLSESRVEKEQEGIICEEAYCHSLLTTRDKAIKLSALRSQQGNRKLSYGSAGYETKDDDYSDGESSPGPKYGQDPLMGVEDALVFTEFAEGIAKLATEEVDAGSSPRDRETTEGARIKLFYELLVTGKALVQPEVIEDPGSPVIPEPVVVPVKAEQKIIRPVPRILNRTNFGGKSTQSVPSIRETSINIADLKRIKAESKASSKSFRK